MFMVGMLYGHGAGVPLNMVESLKWYRKSAALGDNVSMLLIGTVYIGGINGVPKDEVEGVKWLRMASEHGNDTAMSLLGLCYEQGDAVPMDGKEAVKWFRKAADLGNDDAQTYLGHSYGRGFGVLRDDEESVKWLRKAAFVFNPQGMFLSASPTRLAKACPRTKLRRLSFGARPPRWAMAPLSRCWHQ